MTQRVIGCEDRMAYQATIKKQDLCAIFDIKGKAGAVAQRLWHLDLQLPENANTASAKGGQHLCWVGEGHWILLANANELFVVINTCFNSDKCVGKFPSLNL